MMATIYFYSFFIAGIWALLVIPTWIVKFICGGRLILPFFLSVIGAGLAVKLMMLPFLNEMLTERSAEEMREIGIKFWTGFPILLISIGLVFSEEIIRYLAEKRQEK